MNIMKGENRQRNIRELAEALKAIAHPTRLLILKELQKGEKCVRDIQELLDIPQANLSQHLSILRSQKIIDYRRSGRLACYFLRDSGPHREIVDVVNETLSDRPESKKR